MQILYLATNNDGTGVAHQLEREGNGVKAFIQHDSVSGTGIIDRVDSWRDYISSVNFVVSTHMSFARHEKIFKDLGKPFIGCSQFGNLLLTTKRDSFLSTYNIPNDDNLHMSYMLHGFFNGQDWVRPLVLSNLYDKLLPENLGITCDNTGIVLKSIKYEPPFIESISKGLRKLGLRDLVSISFNENYEVRQIICGLLPVVTYGIIEGMQSSLTDILFNVAQGTATEIDFSEDYVVGVKLTVPPWPYRSGADFNLDPLEILGLNDENLKHIALCGVIKEGDRYFADCTNGNTMYVTAHGRHLHEAQRRVYRTLKNISISYKQYRVGVGDDVEILQQDHIRKIIHGV